MNVDSVKEFAEKAEGRGAKILIPPTMLPEGGEMAVLHDPAGMPFCHLAARRAIAPVLKCGAMTRRFVRIFTGFMLLARIPAAPIVAPASQNPPDAAKDSATSDLKTFVGKWRASLNGEVFAVLVLREERGSLAGTLNNFDISVDKDGNLTDGTHKDSGEAPLLNARFKSGALVFVVMQKDQYAPSTEWKFIPKSADEGELTPMLEHQVNAPKDMVVKPIRMVRERSSK